MLTAVTGINWGDEGKGRVIDLLAEQADVVVRYQGLSLIHIFPLYISDQYYQILLKNQTFSYASSFFFQQFQQLFPVSV